MFGILHRYDLCVLCMLGPHDIWHWTDVTAYLWQRTVSGKAFILQISRKLWACKTART